MDPPGPSQVETRVETLSIYPQPWLAGKRFVLSARSEHEFVPFPVRTALKTSDQSSTTPGCEESLSLDPGYARFEAVGGTEAAEAAVHRGLKVPALPANIGDAIEDTYWMEGRQYTVYGIRKVRRRWCYFELVTDVL